MFTIFLLYTIIMLSMFPEQASKQSKKIMMKTFYVVFGVNLAYVDLDKVMLRRFTVRKKLSKYLEGVGKQGSSIYGLNHISCLLNCGRWQKLPLFTVQC